MSTLAELSSRLSSVPVREIPRTPPLNKFGGEFENGWEYFFDDLNNFLQQAIDAQETEGIYVARVGSVVTVTGTAVQGKTVNIGVIPVVAPLSVGGVSIDENGVVSGSGKFTISFIARG